MKINLSRTIHNVGFALKKSSPEILVAVGVIGVVATTVVACKSTIKARDILDETKINIDAIHKCRETEDLAEQYTEEDAKKDLVATYVNTGVQLAKTYAPAIALGTLSIVSILASNNILHKRNVAIAAAYATVDHSFKNYRNRVIDRFGESVDRELKHDIKAVKITETVVDEETGKEKKVKKTVNVVGEVSEYAKMFDDGCNGWDKDPNISMAFLRAQQNYATELLRSRGHLFLNEVYDMLGIPRTKAGQVVGWTYDGVYDEEFNDGDGYVDFGAYDVHRESVRDFVNGYTPAILLDFNVDGVILDDFNKACGTRI